MATSVDRRNLLLLILVGLIWGSAYPVIRYGLLDGATPIVFAASRYALSAVAIAVLAAATGVARPNARALGLSALLGLPIVGLYGLFLYVGEQTTSGGLAAILIAVTPLLTAVFALLLLPGESLGRAGYVGLIVGFLGVVILVFPPPGVVLASSIWGPVAVFAAALSFAIGSVLLRRQRPEGETLWGVSVQFAVATVALAAVLPALEPHPTLPLNSGGLLALAYLVLLPSLVGYALYFYLHHQVGPGRANVVAYVNPVAAISIGTLLFGESFQLWELAGFALVIAGLTILTRYGRPRPLVSGPAPPTDPSR
ncbi:MAG: EamA family transporter [Thermoplasmata archaeon]|nr:EamA family transporter [Thermoplasmata archaeon]MCI4332318.1 EamA family transporter [Thermoplasmata archaeon]